MIAVLPAAATDVEAMTTASSTSSTAPTPGGGIQTMELEELWQVGGEDDEDVLLGIITRVLIDDDNNIYLLDPQLSEIKVFSPRGRADQHPRPRRRRTRRIPRPGRHVFPARRHPRAWCRSSPARSSSSTWTTPRASSTPTPATPPRAPSLARSTAARRRQPGAEREQDHIDQAAGTSHSRVLPAQLRHGRRRRRPSTSSKQINLEFQDLKFDERPSSTASGGASTWARTAGWSVCPAQRLRGAACSTPTAPWNGFFPANTNRGAQRRDGPRI